SAQNCCQSTLDVRWHGMKVRRIGTHREDLRANFLGLSMSHFTVGARCNVPLLPQSSRTAYMERDSLFNHEVGMVQLMNRMIIIGMFLGWLWVGAAAAAENACQEGQEVLGLSLSPQGKQDPDATPGLLVTDITPLSQGARIGLLKGDIIEQVN